MDKESIHATTIIEQNAIIGAETTISYFSCVKAESEIGHHCQVGQHVTVGSRVKVGNYVKLQNNISLYEGVELEDYVFCGPSVVFTNIKNPRSKYPQSETKYFIKTLVKEGASIGANATIVCGVTLGISSFVAAGSVVTKDVPDYAIVMGNPAKRVGWMSEGGIRLDFSQSNKAFCEKSKTWYALQFTQVIKIDGEEI